LGILISSFSHFHQCEFCAYLVFLLLGFIGAVWLLRKSCFRLEILLTITFVRIC
jgi:uncharacterized membrane protein YqjE